MNDFLTRTKKAEQKWASLMTSEEPVIYLGMASCGRAAGALEVMAAVKETLEEHNLKAKIIEVGCIGPCYLEPLMDVVVPGQPRISYANVTAKKAKRIIKGNLVDGDPLTKFAVGHFGDGDAPSVDGLPRFFDLPMLKPQVRIVLRNCGMIDPDDIDHYLANDGNK